MNAPKKIRTATVTTHTIKNGSMNIRGMDLQFDHKGVCKNVPEHIAVLIAPMKHFTVSGLSDAAEEEAESHKAEVESQKSEDKPAYIKGLPDAAAQDAKGYITGLPGGRAMGDDGKAEPPEKNIGEKAAKAEDEEASESDEDDDGEEEESEEGEDEGEEEEAAGDEENAPGDVPMTKAARLKAKKAKKAKK